jgi:Ala-tRNA(Pro) deacylase
MSDSFAPAENPVYARLEALGIAYTRHAHPPIASAEEGGRYWVGIDAAHCKNLFMRNQKGTRHYLVIIHYQKRADLRAVADQIGDGKLSFGSPERLMAHLGVTPGSVSPFGLIHDAARSVRVVIDRDLGSAEKISFHPNINTATIVLTVADFQRFLAACGNPVQYVVVTDTGSHPERT